MQYICKYVVIKINVWKRFLRLRFIVTQMMLQSDKLAEILDPNWAQMRKRN